VIETPMIESSRVNREAISKCHSFFVTALWIPHAVLISADLN